MKKKILYIDMDSVLVDFGSGIKRLTAVEKKKYGIRYDEVPGIFSRMVPMKDAIESYKTLAKHFEVFILSTAPWDNHTGWGDKLLWVQKHLGEHAYKNLILSHRKDLNIGDYLIDDRLLNGAKDFKGELILFNPKVSKVNKNFKVVNNWKEAVKYLLAQNAK